MLYRLKETQSCSEPSTHVMNEEDFFKHHARKRFGQNFLIDHGVIRRILRAIGPRKTDNLVEIGPGQGAITSSLLEACKMLNVVELDRDLIPILKVKFDRFPGFNIHEADALKFDFGQFQRDSEKLRVVGNLPYNISTPLIFHLLAYNDLFEDMHFMLQREVVLRLAAKPGDKNYGRLSVMAQYHCMVENLFEVPPECFRPAPRVVSAIVRLTPHDALPVVAKEDKHFAELTKLAFQQRRKTLRNSLKVIIDNIDVNKLDVDLSLRAERLSVEDFVNLSNQILELKK